MRTRTTERVVAILAIAILAACDCSPIRRTDVPTGGAYRDELQRAQRLAGTLEIRLYVDRLKRGSAETRIFERLGYVRFVGARAEAIGAWSSRVLPGAEKGDDLVDIPIGHQQIEALTYAEHDEPACATYGSAEYDVGYRARVDRLNETGRALLAAHRLLIGFPSYARSWDGRSHIMGVLSVAVDQEHAAEPIHDESGEQIELASYFERTREILLK